MSERDAVRTGALRQRAARLIVFTLLAAVLLGVSAYAESPKPVKVTRCGYANATYGRSALYPWHMSCAAAHKVVTASDNPHAHVINFGPGWDGGAVRINGRYWVCTGQMGYYNCGYPYRPRKVERGAGLQGAIHRGRGVPDVLRGRARGLGVHQDGRISVSPRS